jgi:hypothetical protein
VYDIDWQEVYESPNWRLTVDITQTQEIGPPVFHMPLPLGVYFPGSDTILTLEIDESPEHFEFLFSQEPESIVVDPEVWIIQKNTVTGVSEDIVNKKVTPDKIGTIGRAIEVMLTEPKWIKIYDITGRKVDEFYTKELHYQPSSAGIYHVIIGDTKQKIVIIK